jgi:hypothetical protein
VVKLKIPSDIIPPLYVAECHKDSINRKYEGKHTRGGLISERFFLCLQSPKKGAKTRELYPPKEKMLSIVIRHLFFGDLSQSEKLSEIKPLLPIQVEPDRAEGLTFHVYRRRVALGWVYEGIFHCGPLWAVARR